MCGQNKMALDAKNQEIDFNLLCRFIDMIEPYGLKFGIYLWGGEPFLYSKIYQLIDYIHSKGLYITINTNGTFNADEIIKSKVDRLNISIDGLEELHDEIRGVKGTFKKVIYEIKKMKSSEEFCPFIASNSVITSKNYKKLYDLILFLNSLNIDSINIQFPIFFTKNIGNKYEKRMIDDFNICAQSWKGFLGDYHVLDVPILISQLERIKKEIPDIKFLPDLSNEQIYSYFLYPEEILTDKKCNTPFDIMSIEPNGDVVACTDFPDYVMGNIYNINYISDFLNSSKLIKFKNSLKQNGLMSICSKCCSLYAFD
jgi:radical SAM protein with 4Fe4S-binding SPASM domain